MVYSDDKYLVSLDWLTDLIYVNLITSRVTKIIFNGEKIICIDNVKRNDKSW